VVLLPVAALSMFGAIAGHRYLNWSGHRHDIEPRG